MTKEFLYNYVGTRKLAVISTVNADGDPESAVIGIAVTEELEIIFDTVQSSRKYRNLMQHPRVSLVIGWNDESTVQYEGTVTQLSEQDEQLKQLYYATFPDGRERAATWPDLVYLKVAPHWIRYSNFNAPEVVEEMQLND